MTQIALLLQIAIIMLTSVANNQNATQTQRDQAFTFANQAVTMAMQYIQNPDKATVPTSTIATVPQIVPLAPVTPVEPAPVFGATPAPVSKTVRIESGGCRANIHGLFCDVNVKYLENNIEKNGVPAVLTSDDNGSFVATVPHENPAYGEKTVESRGSANGYVRSRDNIAHFTYRPLEKKQRVLTATVNGATATLEFPGQLDNCAGIIPDYDQEYHCN